MVVEDNGQWRPRTCADVEIFMVAEEAIVFADSLPCLHSRGVVGHQLMRWAGLDILLVRNAEHHLFRQTQLSARRRHHADHPLQMLAPPIFHHHWLPSLCQRLVNPQQADIIH